MQKNEFQRNMDFMVKIEFYQQTIFFSSESIYRH